MLPYSMADAGRAYKHKKQAARIWQPVTVRQDKAVIIPLRFPFLRIRDRRDELRGTPLFDDVLGRLPGLVKLPVFLGVIVWVIDNWLLEELIAHRSRLPQSYARTEGATLKTDSASLPVDLMSCTHARSRFPL